jgi:hypothetical protein
MIMQQADLELCPGQARLRERVDPVADGDARDRQRVDRI